MKAMVLAAGFGKRMRPLTDSQPKPLIKVRGRPMLDHVLDKLQAAGITEIVVNNHYLGEMIAAHLAARTDLNIISSPEAEILETGGGVKHALPLLGDGPWLVCNADMFWLDGPAPLLEQLIAAWDGTQMDALLTLFPREKGFGYGGKGDFHLGADGRLTRRFPDASAPHVFTGVQILRGPELFDDTPDGAFSLNRVYNQAGAVGRLFGLEHADGSWFHIGTPDALAQAEAELADRA